MLSRFFNKTHHSRILIAGTPKSGTTALYYRVKKAMPENTEALFEPGDLKKLGKAAKKIKRPLLAKTVLLSEQNIKFSQLFDKNILVIRDPRDVLISALLYEGGYHVVWEKEVSEINETLECLYTKENNPTQVSVKELWEKITKPSLPIKTFIKRIELVSQFKNDVDCFIMSYDDLVKSNLEKLDNYLEINTKSDTDIPVEHQRVVRTKSSGSWRSWFTAADVEFFKPIMSPLLDD